MHDTFLHERELLKTQLDTEKSRTAMFNARAEASEAETTAAVAENHRLKEDLMAAESRLKETLSAKRKNNEDAPTEGGKKRRAGHELNPR